MLYDCIYHGTKFRDGRIDPCAPHYGGGDGGLGGTYESLNTIMFEPDFFGESSIRAPFIRGIIYR